MKACISIYDNEMERYRYHSINIKNNTENINQFFRYIDLYKKGDEK